MMRVGRPAGKPQSASPAVSAFAFLTPFSYCSAALISGFLTRQPGENMIDLEHPVSGFLHSAATIDGLGRRVVHVDIQTQPAYRTLLLREHLSSTIEGSKDAPAPPLRQRVYALDPPEHAVAPVGPLVGDH